jgi:hypothetical protein
VLFLSGDEQAKPAVVQLIEDAGFEPVDLGGIEDSRFQEPGSALWNTARRKPKKKKTVPSAARAGHAAVAREPGRSRRPPRLLLAPLIGKLAGDLR